MEEKTDRECMPPPPIVKAHLDVSGKVFVVTGGSQGLGKAIARRLLENGAKGLLVCGFERERCEETKKELQLLAEEGKNEEGKTTDVEAFIGDLSKEEDCRAVFAFVEKRWGCVHGLVNSAALSTRGTLETTDVALWDKLFALNVRAPFILTQDATRIMKRERIAGSIVNISSVTSHGGAPFIMAYSCTKGALNLLTKNNAMELRPHRIRVNAIAMGWTLTDTENALQTAEKGEDWLQMAEGGHPFGRLLRPDDIANMALFLLSDSSAMFSITAVAINFTSTIHVCRRLLKVWNPRMVYRRPNKLVNAERMQMLEYHSGKAGFGLHKGVPKPEPAKAAPPAVTTQPQGQTQEEAIPPTNVAEKDSRGRARE